MEFGRKLLSWTDENTDTLLKKDPSTSVCVLLEIYNSALVLWISFIAWVCLLSSSLICLLFFSLFCAIWLLSSWILVSNVVFVNFNDWIYLPLICIYKFNLVFYCFNRSISLELLSFSTSHTFCLYVSSRTSLDCNSLLYNWIVLRC